MANNFNNVSPYTMSMNGSQDTQQVEQQANQQTQQVAYDEAFINQIISTYEKQKHNLTEQREIINNGFAERKALEEKIALLEKENAELKSAKQPVVNSSNAVDPDIINDINSMKEQLNQFQKKELERQVLPVLNLIAQYGVPKEQVGPTLEAIKTNYGVDLLKNPNVDLAQMLLSTMHQAPEPTSIPVGGLQAARVNSQQAAEIAYQKELAEYKAQIYQKYKK